MLEFDVDITTIDALAKALRRAPDLVVPEMAQAAQAGLLLVAADLKLYPPPPANSRYIRTRTLGRTWATAQPTWQVISSGFEARIGNATPYAPRVQGAGTQAAPFKGRWLTDEKALEKNREQILEHFAAAGQRALGALVESL